MADVFVVALEAVVEVVAFFDGESGISGKEPFDVQPVLFHACEGVDQCFVVDGHGEH